MTVFKREQFFGENNKIITRALVYELESGPYNLFTTKEEDYKTYKSLPALYMKYTDKDPSEYLLAQEVFCGWDVWTTFSNSSLVKPFIENYRERNMVHQRSKALRSIIAEVEEGGKNSFAAARLLLGKEWLTEDYKKFVKHKVFQKKETASISNENVYSEDAERISNTLKGLN